MSEGGRQGVLFIGPCLADITDRFKVSQNVGNKKKSRRLLEEDCEILEMNEYNMYMKLHCNLAVSGN